MKQIEYLNIEYSKLSIYLNIVKKIYGYLFPLFIRRYNIKYCYHITVVCIEERIRIKTILSFGFHNLSLFVYQMLSEYSIGTN